MSRRLFNVLMTGAVLACFVVGSNIAWSNIASSVGSQTNIATVEFDQPSAAVTVMPPSVITPAIILTKADFDQVFAAATVGPRRENTPAIRERLRAAGWKRIIGTR